jgi:hypothetical protein
VCQIFSVTGRAQSVAPNTLIEAYEAHDMSGRPSAAIGRKYVETGMQPPDDERDIFSFE